MRASRAASIGARPCLASAGMNVEAGRGVAAAAGQRAACPPTSPVPASLEEMAGRFAPSVSIWVQSTRHDSEDEQVTGAGAADAGGTGAGKAG